VGKPRRQPDRIRLVLEAEAGSGEVRTDQPFGAAFADRRFASRFVETRLERLGDVIPIREDVP
jgi:hypothetical protein